MLIVLCALVAATALTERSVEAFDRQISEFDSTKCLNRFLDYPPSKGKLGFPRCLFENPFPPNPDFWLKDVDFSCVSPWNDECGTVRAGTLISKRHIIFAKHFPLWAGVRILFVGTDGGVCPCRIKAVKALEGSDVMIGSLDAEVTPAVHPAKILPPDFEQYLGDGVGLPVVTFDQRERTFLTELAGLPRDRSVARVWNRTPKSEIRRRFAGKAVRGDSGNPAFLLIGRTPILLYCLHGGGSGSGPWIHLHAREIQAAMDELCPGYKLETFDFMKIRCDDGKSENR